MERPRVQSIGGGGVGGGERCWCPTRPQEEWQVEVDLGRDPRWFLHKLLVEVLELPALLSTGTKGPPTVERCLGIGEAIIARSSGGDAQVQRTPERRHRAVQARAHSEPPLHIAAVLHEMTVMEHLVVGAMARLHRKRVLPKNFERVLEELRILKNEKIACYRTPAISGSSQSLHTAFLRMLELGVLQLSSYSAKDCLRPQEWSLTTLPCQFPAASWYCASAAKFRLPTAVEEWIRTEVSIAQ
eukprot:Polyplicarium_translucidae@DN3815_c0_g1_i1.p1